MFSQSIESHDIVRADAQIAQDGQETIVGPALPVTSMPVDVITDERQLNDVSVQCCFGVKLGRSVATQTEMIKPAEKVTFDVAIQVEADDLESTKEHNNDSRLQIATTLDDQHNTSFVLLLSDQSDVALFDDDKDEDDDFIMSSQDSQATSTDAESDVETTHDFSEAKCCLFKSCLNILLKYCPNCGAPGS